MSDQGVPNKDEEAKQKGKADKATQQESQDIKSSEEISQDEKSEDKRTKSRGNFRSALYSTDLTTDSEKNTDEEHPKSTTSIGEPSDKDLSSSPHITTVTDQSVTDNERNIDDDGPKSTSIGGPPDKDLSSSPYMTTDNEKTVDEDGPKSTTSKEEFQEKELSSSPSLPDKDDFGILGQSRVMNTGTETTPNQEVVTVKFLLENSETFASAFMISSNVRDVKERLSDVLGLNIDSIKLDKDGFDVDDWLPLQGLGVEPFGSLELKLTSTQPGKSIVAASVSEYIPTVDIITVHVWEDGTFKDVIVEIENQSIQKEWLGGFRHKLTNLEYHHASTQTAPRQRKVFDYPEPGVAVPLLFHRDTQTPFPLKEAKLDTSADKSTQMWQTDQFIPKHEDKIISSKPYQCYAEWLSVNNVEEKVVVLQRAVRQWLHRIRVNKLMAVQKYLLEDVKRQRQKILKEQDEKENKIMTDRFPSKRDDFYMLYLMVGKWWQREWQRICDMKSDEAKKAEFVALLEKEIKLLTAIEKHRVEVKQAALKRQRMRFLELSSRPLTFRNARGQLTTIDDPATQRAREFKEIYSRLVHGTDSQKDRIEVLMTLKQLMSNYTAYEYTKDIMKLIDREANLIAIGTSDKDLELLRKRIEQLYMDFIHQPQFNPKVSTYKTPNWTKKEDALHKCTRCMKLLPASRYPVHSRMKAYTVCKSCDWLQNIGHQRIDMTPYMKLLKQVQTTEMQNNCYSSVCFVFQHIGMFFLTSVIWNGHSAISECANLSKLTHVRWFRDEEWAPWNTILLTEEEAKCHLNINSVTEFYNKTFVEAVKQKHILARIHFTPLLKTDSHLRSTGVWQNIDRIVPPIQPLPPQPNKPKIFFKEDENP